MSITTDDRYSLHERLNEVLGRKEAATLMDHLPPVGWADVATKRDLDTQTELLETRMRAELAKSEQHIRGDLAKMEQGIRGDMANMEKAIRGDMAKMEQGIRGDMANMEQGIRGDMAKIEQGIRSDMTDLETGLRGDVDTLSGSVADLRVALEKGLAQLQHRMFTAFVAMAVALFAAVGLLTTIG
ncbi:MAG: hypothetical protein R2754_17120 [Microthrixaceae bacterium]